MSNWNPEQYDRFKSERRQPFDDLLALVEHRPSMRVVDLGCGTGELTRALHETLRAAETVGIDNSETMLLKSDAFEGEMLHFEQGDIEGFVGDRPFDLIFSNAALHWVPDHPALLRRLTGFLAVGGQLAVQMPANEGHASHRIAAEVAKEAPFAETLSGYTKPRHVLQPAEYASLLHALGYKRQHVRLQVYGHLLGTTTDVVEWVKGTLLTDYEKRIPGDLWPEFLTRYRQRLLDAAGDHSPYFFTYDRVLLWGSF
jgi:trans-aconitate 2-methyltransferase